MAKEKTALDSLLEVLEDAPDLSRGVLSVFIKELGFNNLGSFNSDKGLSDEKKNALYNHWTEQLKKPEPRLEYPSITDDLLAKRARRHAPQVAPPQPVAEKPVAKAPVPRLPDHIPTPSVEELRQLLDEVDQSNPAQGNRAICDMITPYLVKILDYYVESSRNEVKALTEDRVRELVTEQMSDIITKMTNAIQGKETS